MNPKGTLNQISATQEKGKAMMNVLWRLNQIAVAMSLLGCFVQAGPAPLDAQTSPVSALTVHVIGARNTKGRIGVVLFRSAEGFPNDTSKAIHQQSVNIDSNTLSAETTFRNLSYGTYAVSVLHDENGNGKMDKNFMGIPKEGYGASNNPRKRMGPPGFDEAKFSVTQPAQMIEIRLIY